MPKKSGLAGAKGHRGQILTFNCFCLPSRVRLVQLYMHMYLYNSAKRPSLDRIKRSRTRNHRSTMPASKKAKTEPTYPMLEFHEPKVMAEIGCNHMGQLEVRAHAHLALLPHARNSATLA